MVNKMFENRKQKLLERFHSTILTITSATDRKPSKALSHFNNTNMRSSIHLYFDILIKYDEVRKKDIRKLPHMRWGGPTFK